MTEYTPTTETVRDRYALSIWPGVEGKDLRGAFDRWLAQVRAEARQQGAREALLAAAAWWGKRWPAAPLKPSHAEYVENWLRARIARQEAER